jgi:two-component system, NtrC family, response regulator AtoC
VYVAKDSSPRRILFVDDEEGIRSTLPRILQNRGFAVTAVGSVSDALAQANRTKYDVLVSDLNIKEPGDGFLVIAAMRLFQPKCINIVLTAYPTVDNAVQGIRHAIADYFVKPVEIEDLVKAINQNLKTGRSGRIAASLDRKTGTDVRTK